MSDTFTSWLLAKSIMIITIHTKCCFDYSYFSFGKLIRF